MAIKTLYTAVGRFERRTNGCNRSCPIILLGGQEYMADMQEMVIWSMLNWRILRWDDIAQEYEKLSAASGYCTERSWEDCTNRLLTRGLLVSGSGETEYDALYDLLASLSIIPTSGPFFLRLASFVKLTLLAHVPVSATRKLFQKDKRTKYEALVMRLAGQALLSTAEIIKCIDKNISRLPNECALLDSLYGDETTTSDNIASMVKISQSSKPVTLAVANHDGTMDSFSHRIAAKVSAHSAGWNRQRGNQHHHLRGNKRSYPVGIGDCRTLRLSYLLSRDLGDCRT